MRFTDFLKATVLTSAAAATLLAAFTVLAATSHSDDRLVPFSAAWWIVAGLSGALLGRRATTTEAIGRLLADARPATALPEGRVGRLLVNRLWPLLLPTVIAAGVGFLIPQVPAIAAGFAILGALAWRRQDAAVTAIEERDGVRFYVERTSPLKPIELVRAPGFKSAAFELDSAGSAHP
jgi:hypothetical protein